MKQRQRTVIIATNPFAGITRQVQGVVGMLIPPGSAPTSQPGSTQLPLPIACPLLAAI